MKKDKILSCIIGVCVALFCGTIGYLFGAQGFNINQKARALKSPVTITKEIKEKGFNTKKIALVNADEAVVQGGKTINYADKLISGMPKNFEELGAKEEDIPTLVKKFGLPEGGRTGGFVKLSSEDIAEIYFGRFNVAKRTRKNYRNCKQKI